jgi:hypothetical protein
MKITAILVTFCANKSNSWLFIFSSSFLPLLAEFYSARGAFNAKWRQIKKSLAYPYTVWKTKDFCALIHWDLFAPKIKIPLPGNLSKKRTALPFKNLP